MEELTAGPVHVDLESLAVNQLWKRVSQIFKMVNGVMMPFLKLYGVEEGHGLSPFASNIDDPNELAQKITDFFKTPKRDPRDRAPSADVAGSKNDVENDGDDVDVVVNGEVSDDYVEAFVKSMLQKWIKIQMKLEMPLKVAQSLMIVSWVCFVTSYVILCVPTKEFYFCERY